MCRKDKFVLKERRTGDAPKWKIVLRGQGTAKVVLRGHQSLYMPEGETRAGDGEERAK